MFIGFAVYVSCSFAKVLLMKNLQDLEFSDLIQSLLLFVPPLIGSWDNIMGASVGSSVAVWGLPETDQC